VGQRWEDGRRMTRAAQGPSLTGPRTVATDQAKRRAALGRRAPTKQRERGRPGLFQIAGQRGQRLGRDSQVRRVVGVVAAQLHIGASLDGRALRWAEFEAHEMHR
jgi:hypothetical protein